MTTQSADEKFLKRILFGLVAATLLVGTLAGMGTVTAGAQETNLVLFGYQTNADQ